MFPSLRVGRFAVVALLTGALASSVVSPSEAASVKADRFPATVAATDSKVTVARKPKRIVSISPTATEILFTIGASKQVIAVDDQNRVKLSRKAVLTATKKDELPDDDEE